MADTARAKREKIRSIGCALAQHETTIFSSGRGGRDGFAVAKLFFSKKAVPPHKSNTLINYPKVETSFAKFELGVVK